MRTRSIILSLSLSLVVGIAGAEPLPLSCPELGIYTIGAALARDKGVAASKVKRDIDEDSNFSARDKAEMRKIVDLVYSRPRDSGTKISYTVESKCHKSSRPR